MAWSTYLFSVLLATTTRAHAGPPTKWTVIVGGFSSRSEGGRLGVGGQERRRMSRERLRILEQRAVPRVRVREQDGVRQVLAQSVRVGDGNHLVVDTVHDERGMTDGPELSESLAFERLPTHGMPRSERSRPSAPRLDRDRLCAVRAFGRTPQPRPDSRATM